MLRDLAVDLAVTERVFRRACVGCL